MGHALESQGNFEEALKFFKTAVSVQEDDVGELIVITYLIVLWENKVLAIH